MFAILTWIKKKSSQTERHWAQTCLRRRIWRSHWIAYINGECEHGRIPVRAEHCGDCLKSKFLGKDCTIYERFPLANKSVKLAVPVHSVKCLCNARPHNRISRGILLLSINYDKCLGSEIFLIWDFEVIFTVQIRHVRLARYTWFYSYRPPAEGERLQMKINNHKRISTWLKSKQYFD
jgi:hypothetical protein